MAAALERIRRLASRSERDRTGCHYVEGFRAVLEALEGAIPVEFLLHSEVLCRNVLLQKLVRWKRREGIPVVRVTPEQFRSVSTTARASGIGTVLHQHWTSLSRIAPHDGLCWITVRRMRSSGNLGTTLRTAEAVGAAGCIFLGNDADPFHPDVVRTSMGGLFHLKLVRSAMEPFRAWARRNGCTVVGTSPSASVPHTQVPLDPPLIVMLGEERSGLSAEEIEISTHMARLPIVGRADSLNVGVAAGVILYEALRRRGWASPGRPAG